MAYGGKAYEYSKGSPVIAGLLSRLDLSGKLGASVFGPTPPNAFVGEYGYPNVYAGPLVCATPDGQDAAGLDDPRRWLEGSGAGAPDYGGIIAERARLVRGKQAVNARRQAGSRYAQQLQDAVLSSASVDVEVEFERPPSFSLYFSPTASPNGPSGNLKRFALAGNPRIPGKVDALVEERLPVSQSLPELLSAGFEVYYIQKLLTAGVLGAKPCLVPTKWGITATDDLVAKQLLKGVRRHPQLNEVLVFSNSAFGNHFEVLLVPGAWEFEQFEAWHASTPWAQAGGSSGIVAEYEGYWGRTKYAELEGGGYYAGRLAVVEWLALQRKQCRAVVFREISEDYVVPLGVAQVRENCRKALRAPPQKPGTVAEALKLISSRLSRPIGAYLKQSRVLPQSRLTDF